MDNIHILAIAGSLREKSYNRALLREAEMLLPPNTSMTIFELHDLPMFNSDVEAVGTPPAVQALRSALKEADALLIATPEYNYSIPGVLKNAIDWASRAKPDPASPLDDLPVALIGASGGGGIRALMHLRQILLHNNNQVLTKPQLLVSRARNEFDENGRLTNPVLRERLQHVLRALRQWTIQLNK